MRSNPHRVHGWSAPKALYQPSKPLYGVLRRNTGDMQRVRGNGKGMICIDTAKAGEVSTPQRSKYRIKI